MTVACGSSSGNGSKGVLTTVTALRVPFALAGSLSPLGDRRKSRICQLTGKYAVRSPRIEPLYSRAKALAVKFRKLRFRWVPREQNKEADALTRRAYASLAGVRMLERAGELAGRVVPLGEGKFLVPSSSGSGSYAVDLEIPSCDCPYFTKLRSRCKHILAAEMVSGV